MPVVRLAHLKPLFALFFSPSEDLVPTKYLLKHFGDLLCFNLRGKTIPLLTVQMLKTTALMQYFQGGILVHLGEK